MAIFVNSILYLMLRSWCRDSINLTYDDVDKWLQEEGMTSDAVMAIWGEFNNSMASYLPEQKETNNDKPKKK